VRLPVRSPPGQARLIRWVARGGGLTGAAFRIGTRDIEIAQNAEPDVMGRRRVLQDPLVISLERP